jgi:hypothetical protein
MAWHGFVVMLAAHPDDPEIHKSESSTTAMGLFRKLTSVSTLGLVDFRSDRERIAKYTKRGYRATRQQTQIMAQGMAAQYQQGSVHTELLSQQVAYQRALFLQTPAGQAQLAQANQQIVALEAAWRHASAMARVAHEHETWLRGSGSKEGLRQARRALVGWNAERDRIAGHVHAARYHLAAVTG